MKILRYERLQYQFLNCCNDNLACNNSRSRIFKGFLSLIPVLVGIIVGYVVAIFMGIVKFDAIMSAKWIDFIYLSAI